jgi:hypothetical protein
MGFVFSTSVAVFIDSCGKYQQITEFDGIYSTNDKAKLSLMTFTWKPNTITSLFMRSVTQVIRILQIIIFVECKLGTGKAVLVL